MFPRSPSVPLPVDINRSIFNSLKDDDKERLAYLYSHLFHFSRDVHHGEQSLHSCDIDETLFFVEGVDNIQMG